MAWLGGQPSPALWYGNIKTQTQPTISNYEYLNVRFLSTTLTTASTINAININSSDVNTNTLSTFQVHLSSNTVLTGGNGSLYINGILVTDASNSSNTSQWADFPAITTINANNKNIINAKSLFINNIFASNIYNNVNIWGSNIYASTINASIQLTASNITASNILVRNTISAANGNFTNTSANDASFVNTTSIATNTTTLAATTAIITTLSNTTLTSRTANISNANICNANIATITSQNIYNSQNIYGSNVFVSTIFTNNISASNAFFTTLSASNLNIQSSNTKFNDINSVNIYNSNLIQTTLLTSSNITSKNLFVNEVTLSTTDTYPPFWSATILYFSNTVVTKVIGSYYNSLVRNIDVTPGEPIGAWYSSAWYEGECAFVAGVGSYVCTQENAFETPPNQNPDFWQFLGSTSDSSVVWAPYTLPEIYSGSIVGNINSLVNVGNVITNNLTTNQFNANAITVNTITANVMTTSNLNSSNIFNSNTITTASLSVTGDTQLNTLTTSGAVNTNNNVSVNGGLTLNSDMDATFNNITLGIPPFTTSKQFLKDINNIRTGNFETVNIIGGSTGNTILPTYYEYSTLNVGETETTPAVVTLYGVNLDPLDPLTNLTTALTVYGDTSLNGKTSFYPLNGTLTAFSAYGNTYTYGFANITGLLSVGGAATVTGFTTMLGGANVVGEFTATGLAALSGGALVTGVFTVQQGDVNFNNNGIGYVGTFYNWGGTVLKNGLTLTGDGVAQNNFSVGGTLNATTIYADNGNGNVYTKFVRLNCNVAVRGRLWRSVPTVELTGSVLFYDNCEMYAQQPGAPATFSFSRNYANDLGKIIYDANGFNFDKQTNISNLYVQNINGVLYVPGGGGGNSSNIVASNITTINLTASNILGLGLRGNTGTEGLFNFNYIKLKQQIGSDPTLQFVDSAENVQAQILYGSNDKLQIQSDSGIIINASPIGTDFSAGNINNVTAILLSSGIKQDWSGVTPYAYTNMVEYNQFNYTSLVSDPKINLYNTPGTLQYWETNGSYNVGNIRYDATNGNQYYCKLDITGGTVVPSSNTTNWELYSVGSGVNTIWEQSDLIQSGLVGDANSLFTVGSARFFNKAGEYLKIAPNSLDVPGATDARFTSPGSMNFEAQSGLIFYSQSLGAAIGSGEGIVTLISLGGEVSLQSVNSNVLINGGAGVTITSPASNIKINTTDANSDIDLNSARNVNINGANQVNITGGLINVNNTTSFNNYGLTNVKTINGKYLFNYGFFYKTTTQTLDVANTARRVTIQTSSLQSGITLDTTTNIGRITFTNPGIYSVVWSAYLLHETGGGTNSYIWIRKNGTDVPGTGKIENNDSQLNETNLTSSSLISITANDYIEFFWAATNVNVPLRAIAASGILPATSSFSCSINIVG